ncbi:MAG: chromosome segregation protein SMC [Proteobacteria bacterium]|nr:chromosome segregation protein SMC [Pseudomonadota bacterium]
MQFTKLRLSGFKSFVDPAELLIEPGVTGIVGPNGCGKSNLVEALRWVMGENSAKRMRGGEMDDVIFAGSANRPGRNLAEVVVYLDNADRGAPALFNDHDLLEVVRSIERGSGSTFRVNGKEVRARDVQLLFADVATGAHSTALVSQGRVGALINAKPTDRRAILEEAAGITGLHNRRHEAELRLRAAETNLERLDDVITTLEAQLRGLKKQARQATRYRNIAGQIRRTEALALHLEAEVARAALGQARGRLAEAERQVAALTERAAARATAQAEAAASLPELRDGEARAAAALQRLLVERDNLAREEAQARAAQAQAEERLRQLQGDRARARAMSADAEAARRGLDQERAALENAAADEAGALRGAEAARAEAAESVASRETVVGELAERVAADEARAAALERRAVELAERLERLEAQAETVAERRRTLAGERIPEDRLSAAESAAEAAEDALARARAEAETTESALARARTEEAAARETAQRAQAECAKLEAEAAALATLLGPDADGDWPPLVDAIAVEPGYEPALGAALGDDIAAPADSAAPAHWQTLSPYQTPVSLPPGAAPLADQVRGPAALARRLSQIGVVPDVDTGARLQPRLAPGQRLVTRDGDLWRWDGFTVKAEARTVASKRLEQRNRLTELHGLIERSAPVALEAGRVHDEARAQVERAAEAERGARAKVAAAFGALNAARQSHGALAQTATATASRLGALEETAERLAGDATEVEAALTAARGEIDSLPELSAERTRLGQLRLDLSERRDELARCQSALDRLAREAEARARRLSAIESEKASWARRAEETEGYLGELDERIEATRAEIDSLAARPGELAALGEALADRIEAAEARRREAADALALGETGLAEADRALKAQEQALASAREDRVRAEGAVAQAEQNLANITEKVRERLECALDRALEVAEIDPGQELPGREEVETKLARLYRERDNMGPVNLRAEAEAKELDAQIGGMQSERADLVAAIGRLRQGIASLNREGRERLLAAFERVNEHFSELFVRLFGGGRAHLKLTEAEDPLEAGLEILASPPGKRLQVLSLLSGGEQALTALALLFAVFLTNPAPICVLDEVDAPLDDANVDRFCTLVEELCRSQTTRFLVITHHRMTMARVDRLFGVTMGERGVSQLVSVDLGVAEGLRESA